MATQKWVGAWVSRGTVLTTELNGLGIGAYSALGTAVDNSANLDQFGVFVISLNTLSPTTGATVTLFIAQAVDGTNYEAAPASTNAAFHQNQNGLIVSVDTTASATKLIATPPILLPPAKFKVALLNGAGVALNATGNTVTLYTNNLAVN